MAIASFFRLVFVFNCVIFALLLTDVVCSFVSTNSSLFQRVSSALSFLFRFSFAILYVNQLAYCGFVLCSFTEHPLLFICLFLYTNWFCSFCPTVLSNPFLGLLHSVRYIINFVPFSFSLFVFIFPPPLYNAERLLSIILESLAGGWTSESSGTLPTPEV